MVLSLSAEGLTHGEIHSHLTEIFGAEVSKQTISTITDQVMEGMAEWQNRPLEGGTFICRATKATTSPGKSTRPRGEPAVPGVVLQQQREPPTRPAPHTRHELRLIVQHRPVLDELVHAHRPPTHGGRSCPRGESRNGLSTKDPHLRLGLMTRSLTAPGVGPVGSFRGHPPGERQGHRRGERAA
jgi:Transposase, Mutator family